MCKKCSSEIRNQPQVEKKFRLADFFDAHWDNYLKSPSQPITSEQFKAVNAIRVCRTAALGTDIYACESCGEITEVHHSCKNRFCPTCSWNDTQRWGDRVQQGMFKLPHRHCVFTLPHALNGIAKYNRKKILDILMRTSAETVKDWMLHKHGVKCGILSVLHTFGEKKDCHLHTHMIVSWGGLQPETGALVHIPTDYVNYDFLKKKFRIKFEDELIKLFNSGQLEHGFSSIIEFKQFLKRINKKNWVAHIEPPMEDPGTVVKYIGRYSKRACISEYKITEMEGEYISFRYKNNKLKGTDGKALEEILRLHYREFFPRLLQHVPLPNFRLVRYYGYYSAKSCIPEAYRYGTPTLNTTGSADWETLQVEKQGESPLICKACGTRKKYQYTLIKPKNHTELIYERKQMLEREQKLRKTA